MHVIRDSFSPSFKNSPEPWRTVFPLRSVALLWHKVQWLTDHEGAEFQAWNVVTKCLKHAKWVWALTGLRSASCLPGSNRSGWRGAGSGCRWDFEEQAGAANTLQEALVGLETQEKYIQRTQIWSEAGMISSRVFTFSFAKKNRGYGLTLLKKISLGFVKSWQCRDLLNCDSKKWSCQLTAPINWKHFLGRLMPWLDSFSREMTGNEGASDATKVLGRIWTKDVADHGQDLNPKPILWESVK